MSSQQASGSSSGTSKHIDSDTTDQSEITDKRRPEDSETIDYLDEEEERFAIFEEQVERQILIEANCENLNQSILQKQVTWCYRSKFIAGTYISFHLMQPILLSSQTSIAEAVKALLTYIKHTSLTG